MKQEIKMKINPQTGLPLNVAPMHKWLTDFDKYNEKLPIYIEKPFTDEQIDQLRSVIEANRALMTEGQYDRLQGSQEQYYGQTRFHPKKIVHMSRLLIEFNCPPEIEAVMDSYAKPLHKDPIRLTHYNYIDYNVKYGDGKHAPALPPHLDADENLVTFNYCLDQNIEDWEVWVEDKPYNLKKGDALIFSAVNQVHWRPKRKWKEGEFVEIVSFDYCPVTNYRWTGQFNPIDPRFCHEEREAYGDQVAKHPKMMAAWDIYNEMGLKDGIHQSEIAGFVNE
jgi:hypothetical protein